MIAYLIAGVAILAMVSGLAYKTYEAGADKVRLEWREEAAKSVKISEAHRKRQEAARNKADKEATRRLNDFRARSQTIMASLEAHIKVARLSPDCRITPELLNDANNALSGGQSIGPGAVPSKPTAATPTR